MSERITEEELAELEKFYDFGFGNGARLIAEIRLLRAGFKQINRTVATGYDKVYYLEGYIHESDHHEAYNALLASEDE